MSFDPQAATAAYIDSLGADALAKAAAYTVGNHWLLLWNLLVSALVAWLIVRSGVLDRVNAKLGARGPNLRAFVIAAVYFVVANLLALPWYTVRGVVARAQLRPHQPAAQATSSASRLSASPFSPCSSVCSSSACTR